MKPDGQNSVIQKWMLPESFVFRPLVKGNEDSGNEIVGLIDRTHIAIKGPRKDREDYFNRVGCPGSMHDAHVYRYSKLFERIERGKILTQPVHQIGRYTIPLLLLGDAAYPLSKTLLKP